MWFGFAGTIIGDNKRMKKCGQLAIVVSASYREWLGTASGWQHSDTRGGLVRRGLSQYQVLGRSPWHKKTEHTKRARQPAGKAAFAMWVLCVCVCV